MHSDRKLVAIQMLRGVAVVMVVAYHIIILTLSLSPTRDHALTSSIRDIASLGASGVDLFFVISGFVMAHVTNYRQQDGAFDFIIRRVIRIFPMFWLISIPYILWTFFRGSPLPQNGILNTLTIIPANPEKIFPILYVGWSLSFEVMFYLSAAVVIFFGGSRSSWALIISTALASLLGFLPTFHRISPILFNPIMGDFALGALVWKSKKNLSKLPSFALLLLGLLFLSQPFFNPFTPGFSIHPDQIVTGQTSVSRLLLWGVPYALIVASVVNAEPNPTQFTRWLAKIGDASYSIYLGHPLVIEVLNSILRVVDIAFGLAVAFAILIVALMFGYMVHIGVERPLLSVMRRSWRSGHLLNQSDERVALKLFKEGTR